mmetsp:Transcript_1447/g.3989  ORF Transcript_1447/g.3989 Transcript_1447/m.3989 type:complete len:87 (+) Transcript_1447:77-337(+)
MDSIKNTLGLGDNHTSAEKFGDGVGDATNNLSSGIQGAVQTAPKDAAHHVGNAGQVVQGGAQNAGNAMGNTAVDAAEALKGALGQK